MSLTAAARTLRRLAPALLVAMTACGPLHRGPANEPAIIYFTNESLDQADVYAVTPGGDRRRIGTVMSGRTETLTIPAAMIAGGLGINIVARVLARSGVIQTGQVTIFPGEAYEVRLPADQKLLSFLPARSQ